MRAPWGPAVWIFANHSRFLVLRHGTRCVTTPPAMETMTLQETPDIFQRRNDSTVIKACWSLSAKNCHCIKERANSDPFAIAVTVRWVDRRSQKISAVCWMRLRQNVNFVSRYWFRSLKTLCSASSTCRQQEIFKARKNLWRNFRENKFSRAGVWLRKTRKFPAIEAMIYSRSDIFSDRRLQKS